MKTNKKRLQPGILSIHWQKMSEQCVTKFWFYPTTNKNSDHNNNNNNNININNDNNKDSDNNNNNNSSSNNNNAKIIISDALRTKQELRQSPFSKTIAD